MEIELVGKPVAEAEIDVERFKYILSETMDLEKAVQDSMKVIKVREVKEQTFRKHLFLFMHWGKIIDALKYRADRVIKFRMMYCKYKCMTIHKPLSLTENFREYRTKEDREDGTGFCFINSLIGHPSFMIGNFLSNQAFQFDKDEWKAEIRL